jgi:transposase
MRYELSDYEWTAIKPMLPNKPRGVRRVNDRRVLNGIFWVLRSGALPENYGPYTTCYNRFVRWRRAGIWDQTMEALAAGRAQSGRTALQQDQAMPTCRDPIRQTRGQLSGLHQTRFNPILAAC